MAMVSSIPLASRKEERTTPHELRRLHDGSAFLSSLRSRFWTLHATASERGPQSTQDRAEPPIHVKDARRLKHGGDLTHGPFVSESKSEKESILRLQFRDRCAQPLLELRAAHPFIGCLGSLWFEVVGV